MKKYKDLYEEEKQRHEEALQRYQEDHMDEIKIINLHKKCNKKAREVSEPKKGSVSPKSDEPKKTLSNTDEPKKVSKPSDDPVEKEQKPKKASSNGKKNTKKAGKKVKKTSQPKKTPKSAEFIDSSGKEEGTSQDDKRKKIPPLLRVKEEAQSFFDLQKENKNLAIEKKVEKVVFMAGPYKGYELSYVALCDTKYLKRVLKMSGLEKKTRDLIKQAMGSIETTTTIPVGCRASK